MNHNFLKKAVSTILGMALSITVLALNPLPYTHSFLFFGEPEFPSEDE